MDLETTLAEINKLPVADRIGLVQRVLDGIAGESSGASELGLPAEFRVELDRRIALADADPSRGIPWEEIDAELEARERE